MQLLDIIFKFLAIFLFALGTILACFGVFTFKADVRIASYQFFAAIVLFGVGSLFFLITSKAERRRESGKPTPKS